MQGFLALASVVAPARVLRSWLRREVLPSIATRATPASGRCSFAQAVKQAVNRSGSTRFITTRSQSSQGMPQ